MRENAGKMRARITPSTDFFYAVMWLLLSNAGKESQKEPLLGCTHEVADNRIMFHLSHGVKVGKFKRILIASRDTDDFVCSIHNYGKTYAIWLRMAVICGRIEHIQNLDTFTQSS